MGGRQQIIIKISIIKMKSLQKKVWSGRCPSIPGGAILNTTSQTPSICFTNMLIFLVGAKICTIFKYLMKLSNILANLLTK